MAEIKRTVLFGKLNSIGYKSLESATVFTKMRGNPCVELVHWLQQILQLPDSDFARIIAHFEVNTARLAADVTAALDRLPRGATTLSALSSHLDDVLENAWLFTTLMFESPSIRTGHLLVSILKNRTLSDVLLGISPEFSKIKVEALSDAYEKITAGSVEEGLTASDGSRVTGGAAPGEASSAMAPAPMGKQEALARFSVDLTQRARRGEMDPILGRDEEIRKIVDILMRRRQNNPILTGEAGVGKTAVVEAFAQRIVRGDVPPMIRDVKLLMLDVGLLQAGASMKGEFENRLRQVIEEVQSSPTPIILFIDEAHTLIGAGGTAGTGDAANLLKPALARGTLRTIAATTWAEYKKYIEKDPALTRRFQVVKVEEPSEEKALLMLRGIADTLEKHHGVLVLDEAIEAAVSLSHRYIAGRQLPDKAVSLLDTACARVAVSLHAVPAEVEDSRKRMDALATELTIINRETALGYEHEKQLTAVKERLSGEEKRLMELEAAWETEKDLTDRILECRSRLGHAEEPAEGLDGAPSAPPSPSMDAAPSMESSTTESPVDTTPVSPDEATPESPHDESHKSTVDAPPPPPDDAAPESPKDAGPPVEGTERRTLQEELKSLQEELKALQNDSPLVLSCVDAVAVGAVVADWTGIPLGGMVKDEVASVLNLSDTLEKRVIGQRHALDAIGKRIRTARAGVDNPKRPVGVFFLAGPSGVGKTETALALAEAMYGGEQNLITINMSEFQEAHTVSTLKGAPPGYVGYGEGGVLTEAVRRHPHSVVLLDEVEKAHPDVHEIFFQVFDKGAMEDGEGRMIDFKNTVIILTSNVGSELIMSMCKDPELMPGAEGLAKALREPLLKVFPAALLGRLVTIPFYPLSDEVIEAIIVLQLSRIRERLLENRDIEFTYDQSVPEVIKHRCTELESGARMVDAILTNTLLPEISTAYLSRVVEGKEVEKFHVGTCGEEFTYEIT